MIFIETHAFTRRVVELLSDDDYARFQRYLADHPEIGDVMEGTGGLRKVRIAVAARGKRGGARVIYYHFASRSHLAMLLIFAKNEREDLTSEQRRTLRHIVEKWKRHHEHVI